jgi:hypothetical protein
VSGFSGLYGSDARILTPIPSTDIAPLSIKCHEFPIRRRDGWVIGLADESTTGIFKEILDQLNLGEMPPAPQGQARHDVIHRRGFHEPALRIVASEIFQSR